MLDSHSLWAILLSKGIYVTDRDDTGDWYFLSLNSFRLKNPEVTPLLRFFSEEESRKLNNTMSQQKAKEFREMSERMSTCKLCLIQFSPSQLPHKLTMKMLIETEKQIRVIL